MARISNVPEPGGGGSGLLPGQFPVLEVALAALVSDFTTSNATYDNGVLGVGATLTANSNGAATFDGVSPLPGYMILVSLGNLTQTGVYTVTQVGDAGSPCILTRLPGYDTADVLGNAVLVTVSPLGDTAANRVFVSQPDHNGLPFVVGTTGIYFGVGFFGVPSSFPFTWKMSAGLFPVVLINDSNGPTALAVLDPSLTGGAHALVGTQANTLDDGTQDAKAKFHSSVTMGLVFNGPATFGLTNIGATADATPTDIIATTMPDFAHTSLLRGTVSARDTTTPGTDSVWQFIGVVRGDGSSAISWVGSAPAALVVAQDTGAAAWAAVVSISGEDIVVTVTGDVADSVDWSTVIQLEEVS
jgi:hypothetical protein